MWSLPKSGFHNQELPGGCSLNFYHHNSRFFILISAISNQQAAAIILANVLATYREFLR